jgi:hypothetical protein
MKSSRVINLQHEEKAKGTVVESWIEQYPDGEYKKAMNGEDHKIYTRKFGSDVIHSGAWALGVQLGDAEWKAFESGKLNAFSPGGVGMRTEITKEKMPIIEVIELFEK